MYSKMLLSNLTLGQDNLLFLGLNVTHTDFTGLNIISFLRLELKHTSNIFYKPIALGTMRQISSAYIT